MVRSLERATGMEEATKKGQVQEFFYKKAEDVQDNPWPNWANVFEKAMRDMKAEVLNVELKSNVALKLEEECNILSASSISFNEKV